MMKIFTFVPVMEDLFFYDCECTISLNCHLGKVSKQSWGRSHNYSTLYYLYELGLVVEFICVENTIGFSISMI